MRLSNFAVIITNSVGAPNGSAQKDVRTSMAWMGVSKIYTCGAPMMGDISLDKMSQKHLDNAHYIRHGWIRERSQA
ncbi:MAG: hypothetical protein PHG30_07215 [Eubacteriales bacterium]|nr:hypothetical protein [Eubacteriales bacterium]